MQLIEFGDLTAADRADLEGDEHDPFDEAGNRMAFRPKERHVGLRDADGRLVASAGMTTADVQVGDARFPVVGLGGVIVNAGYRGRGLARRVVDAALTRARSLGPDFMILFCHPDRQGLYDRLGFTVVEQPALVRQPSGYAEMPQLMMWHALRPQARWPSGRPVLHTLPF